VKIVRRLTIRAWLLVISVLFSVLTVGGISLVSYAIVYEGMVTVAKEHSEQVVADISDVVRMHIDSVRQESPDLVGTEYWRALVLRLSAFAAGWGAPESHVALHDSGGRLLWVNTPDSAVIQDPARLEEALNRGQILRTTTGGTAPFQGMFFPAALPVYITHIPLELPDGSRGVLTITHRSINEEQVIDAVRSPMLAHALVAALAMMIVVQMTLGRILKLVDNLRLAAESIDAGRLDVRLPEEGEHEISRLARVLNTLIDRLQRKAEAQARFIADASHELATPVAGIRGYTNILKKWGAADPEVQAEAIAAIDRESNRMARLCKDLLALVRDERTMEIQSVRFDLNAVCRETLAAAATRYMSKGLEFIGPEEGQLIMIGDSDKVGDMISILVDNAAKYTEKGSVSVQTRRKRDTIVIEIADTGIGIPPQEIENIFERFYRSDVSRSKRTGGFGLGLPIAKTIVDGIGGTIEVSSTVGVGSIFTVRLPRGRM